MQMLTHSQAEQTSGGILWTTPALVAIMDSACFGPLVGAFGAGYAIGTVIYDNFLGN